MNLGVEELFHELADLPAEVRTRYFTEHDVEATTREEVEALLACDSGTSPFLLREISIAARRVLPSLEVSGRRCGPYRLLNVIGRGGMGAVYLARRLDGAVNQQVAVKLLPLGANDSQRERFLRETEILSALSHPNIAHVLDAGRSNDGEPFLVMEYIDGKPIDVFAMRLSLRERVALFLKVCAATAYLHRNLVVHRDLKPGNILVTAHGEPKLIDFGIAKILDPATDSTMTGMHMLTPDYTSPEQVRGWRASTAMDMYSLGAVLYRLLTGKPPHEFESPGAETIARVVTAREVTRPSKWTPELKGDLELILLKALRKDPRERYATAEQLGEDLQAFLESRPVRARSGNGWSHASQFLRRHWFLMAAPLLAITSFSAGLVVANRGRNNSLAQRHTSQGI
jgi:serine/threonine protein kinase